MKNQFAREHRGNMIASRLMVSRRVCVSVLMGIYLVLTLGGCTWIGLMRSDDQSFTGNDSLLLQVSRPDILDVVAEVGKSMGYRVTDKEANIIRLSSSSSTFDTEILGRLSHTTLRISSNNDGRKLDIDVFVSGNFDTGSQEAATKMVNDFKSRLLETLARTAERSREKGALDNQSAGGIVREPSEKQKPEAPKADALSSTPSTAAQKDAQPAPPPPAVSVPEETKAAVTAPSKADKPSSPLPGSKLVCIKAANVRTTASTKAKIIRVLRKGEEVEYLGTSGNWVNVKLSSGAKGWVFNDLLKSK
jgi:hypothetical protein